MRESFVTISVSMKMYGWSKWGGAREGLVKENLDIWYCQTCGGKLLGILPSYMFPVDELGRDFVRVCSFCKAKAVIKKLTYWQEILKLMR